MKKDGGSKSTIIISSSKSVLVYALHSLEYVLGLVRFRVYVPKLYMYVCDEDVLTECQCQNWFAKFRFCNFNLEDAPRPGSPANRLITTREIAERFNLLNATVYKHIKCLELISKLDKWVLHVLTERNLLRCINDCNTLIRRQRYDPF